ncbi:MAG: hypothetical protein ACLGGX_01725 [Bdellovibrionia bacterium]
MKHFALTLFALLAAKVATAQEMQVVDIRRNITLSEDELPYKDFYITLNGASNLKKNLVVKAVRSLNIRDASGAQSYGEIKVPVGQLKIIAIYDKVAVAREYSLLSRDDLPMLEQIGIMTGDTIDTQGSFIDNKKPKPARKTVSITEPVATPNSETQKAEVPAEMLEKVASSGN